MKLLNSINVLDHGYVRLVDYMGSDLSIVRSARVSYNADWRAGEDEGSDKRLINYLYGNSHNTPFESVSFTFQVKAPIFVLRQWHRHRTWSYNEVSARYTELPEEYYVPREKVITAQSKDNKQMRTGEQIHNSSMCQAIILEHNKRAFKEYYVLLDMGCPRELARSVLPVATYSKMFGTVNLHNLFRFLTERLHPHAQYEIREYAKVLLALITPVVPTAVEAFTTNLSKDYEL